MSLMERLNADPLPWLLEPDDENPGVRYFAMRDLLGKSEGEPQVKSACKALMKTGPVPVILNNQHPEGYWVYSGAGYSPKYKASTWQILFLAALGANPKNEQVRLGCEYVLNNSAVPESGAYTCNRRTLPRGVVICLNGNLLHALLRLGYNSADPRIAKAFNRMAQIITNEEESEGYSWGGLRCGANGGKPCVWGGIKMLKALLAVPAEKRTRAMQQMLQTCERLLTSHDPAAADYPRDGAVSPYWYKFGFPLTYASDILEAADVLVKLGYGKHPLLRKTLDAILKKQDLLGRWKQENAIHSRMWVNPDIRPRGAPSKWVTLRVLRLLYSIDRMDTEITSS
jgi:hypothetical protein